MSGLWSALRKEIGPRGRIGFFVLLVGLVILRFSGALDRFASVENRPRPTYRLQLDLDTPHPSHIMPAVDPDRA